MFITGQIKKLQLFWVDKRNKDKVKSRFNNKSFNLNLDFYSIDT